MRGTDARFVEAMRKCGCRYAASASGQLTPIPPKPRKHKTKKKAHKAQSSENTCQLEAEVTLVYSAS